jgi:TonB family protein
VSVAVGRLPRPVRTGPALRARPIPVLGLTLSTLLHLALIVAAVLAVQALKQQQSQVYIVNLVPAVAAIGSPEGQKSAPPQPAPRRVEPPPAPVPRDLPARDTFTSAPPRDLPPRAAAPRDLPPRSKDSIALPDRPPAVRAPGPVPPRRDQKELPTIETPQPSTPTPPSPPSSTPSSAGPPSTVAAAPPPQPLGQPTGSPQGQGKLTVNVTDFPYAWYIAALTRNIWERWDPKALPGKQPQVVFRVGRNGTIIGRVEVEKSSGNPAYDRTAARAVEDAAPFPPLPDEYKESSVTIHIPFEFSGNTGRG